MIQRILSFAIPVIIQNRVVNHFRSLSPFPSLPLPYQPFSHPQNFCFTMIDVVFAFPDGQMHSTEVDSAGTVRTLRRAAEDAAPGHMIFLGLQLCDTELLDEEALCDTGLCAGDTVKVTCSAPSREEAVEILNNIAGGEYKTCASLQWPAVLAGHDRMLMLLLACAEQPDWYTVTRLIGCGEVGVLTVLAQRYEYEGRYLDDFVLACQSCIVDDVQEVLHTVLTLRCRGSAEAWISDNYDRFFDSVICLRRGHVRHPHYRITNTGHAEAVDLCLQRNLTPPTWWLSLERPDGALSLLEGAARTGRMAILECLLEEGLISCGDLAVPCCEDGNVFHLALHCSVFLQRLRAFHAYAWQWCGCVGDEEEQLVRALEQDNGRLNVLDSAIDRNVDVGPARQSSEHCLQLVTGWIRSKRPQHPYAALWRCGVGLHHMPQRVSKYVEYYDYDWAIEDDPPDIAGDSSVRAYDSSARRHTPRKRRNRAQYLCRRMGKRTTQARAYMRSVKCDLLWG